MTADFAKIYSDWVGCLVIPKHRSGAANARHEAASLVFQAIHLARTEPAEADLLEAAVATAASYFGHDPQQSFGSPHGLPVLADHLAARAVQLELRDHDAPDDSVLHRLVAAVVDEIWPAPRTARRRTPASYVAGCALYRHTRQYGYYRDGTAQRGLRQLVDFAVATPPEGAASVPLYRAGQSLGRRRPELLAGVFNEITARPATRLVAGSS